MTLMFCFFFDQFFFIRVTDVVGIYDVDVAEENGKEENGEDTLSSASI